MTLGSGLDESGGDLAALMSAFEDRAVAGAASRTILPSASFEVTSGFDPSDGVNASGGSSYTDELPVPVDSSLTGTIGAGNSTLSAEMCGSLCSDLSGFSGLLETVGRTDLYLTLMAGKPWPTPFNEGRVSAGAIAPTVMGVKSSINKGWNAASQPGAAPSMMLGFSDKTLGPSTWEEALNYAPSPLAEKIGALQGLSEITGSSDPGMRKVLAAAAKPGTQAAGKVARELLAQSVKLGALTGKRAAVMESARKNYTRLVREVGNLEGESQVIGNRLFDADGDPLDNASLSDFRRYRKLRKQAFAKGREAIRYQKTNVLATGLTKNGYAQAKLLQDMAMTMMVGRPKTTAILAAQFEAVGKESGALRAIRDVQTSKWKAQRLTKTAEGFQGFSDPVQKLVNTDYFEAELAGMEFFDDAYLGELEGVWGWVKKKAKKAYKKTKKVVKKTVRTVKRTVKVAAKVTSKVARGKFKGAAKTAYRAASRTASSVYRAAKKRATSAARQAWKGVKTAQRISRKVYTPIKKTVQAMAKPAWRGVKSAARVAYSPVKMSYDVGRHAVHGRFNKIGGSIVRNVKSTARNIATIAATVTFGMQCAFDKSPLGQVAAKAVGQAVGTFYGGPVGGAVGHEAGRKANQAARGICDGMDRIGLTTGRLRPGQIGAAFKSTASKLAKQTFAPKELLKSGMNVGMNYATAGVAPGAGSSITSIATQQLTQRGKAFARQQIQQEVINRNPVLRKLSQSTPFIKAAYDNIGAFRGGDINMDALKSTLQKQGTAALTKYGPQAAGKIVGGQAGRAIGTAGRLYNMSPAQRTAYARSQAVKQGARGVAAIAGRRAGQYVAGATAMIGMSPAQREAFIRRQAYTAGRRIAPGAARLVGGRQAARLTIAARRAQILARMSPSARAAYARRVAVRAPAVARRVVAAAPKRLSILQRIAARRAASRHARTRMALGVPGALLQA